MIYDSVWPKTKVSEQIGANLLKDRNQTCRTTDRLTDRRTLQNNRPYGTVCIVNRSVKQLYKVFKKTRLGTHRHSCLTYSYVWSHIPAPKSCGKIVSSYYNWTILLHGHHHQRQNQRPTFPHHWGTATTTTVTVLSILCSILLLTVMSWHLCSWWMIVAPIQNNPSVKSPIVWVLRRVH